MDQSITEPTDVPAQAPATALTKRGVPGLIVVSLLAAVAFVVLILTTLFGNYPVHDNVLIGLWVVAAVASLLASVVCLLDIWRAGALPRDQRWTWSLLSTLAPILGPGLYWSECIRHRPIDPA